MTPETVKIAIRCVDGSVAIMSFITLGRGNVLPHGATWKDHARGVWQREPTDENLFHEISRMSYLNAVGYRRILDAEIPVDRTFRDALEDDGVQLKHSLPKAREIHLARVRRIRAGVLAKLDGEWMRAMGQGKKQEADDVEAKRQALRDLPTTLGVEGAQTTEELKALWSPLLDE